MTGQNPLKKKFPCATCLHCKKVTDIQFSHDYNHLVAQNKTLVERIKFEQNINRKIHSAKNAQKQMYTKMFGKILLLLTPEQMKEIKSISQELRDRLKEIEKEMFT